MTDHPLPRVLHRTMDVLDGCVVEVAVMGGFAVRHWALPRPTYDVDFAVAVDGEALARLLQAFEEAGFSVDAPFRKGFVDTLAGMAKVGIGCFEAGTVWRVDLFLATNSFVSSALERRVPTEIEGRHIAVITPEDLLLFKLLADRAKDRADIEDLLLVCGKLDRTYLAKWAAHLEIEERLDRALRESGRA